MSAPGLRVLLLVGVLALARWVPAVAAGYLTGADMAVTGVGLGELAVCWWLVWRWRHR